MLESEPMLRNSVDAMVLDSSGATVLAPRELVESEKGIQEPRLCISLAVR